MGAFFGCKLSDGYPLMYVVGWMSENVIHQESTMRAGLPDYATANPTYNCLFFVGC